jgi:AcrR family transcriptional regulator
MCGWISPPFSSNCRNTDVLNPAPKGRPNQKQRTRKDLLEAAARLVREGRRPTLDDVAEAALISRATAYRYFPNIEALLIEASIQLAAPDAGLLEDALPSDPVERLQKVDAAFETMILENEAPLRLMLARIVERGVRGDAQSDLPLRQNRRLPLIEAALEPSRPDIDPGTFEKLVSALSILIGTESFVVTKDVLRLSDAQAREVRRWAIEALVAAAMRAE